MRTRLYLYIPTSNHNAPCNAFGVDELYIFIFLHQTTTLLTRLRLLDRCISLYSYIKPQLQGQQIQFERVVYLYIPTSNHNPEGADYIMQVLYIFIFLHQTTT